MKLNTVTIVLIFVLSFATLFCEAEVGTIRKTKAKATKNAKNTNTKKGKKGKKGKNTKALTPKKGKASSCKKVKNYKASKDSRLDGIIKSLVESQDFSSYCRSDFMVAREWFLNMANHPTDLPADDDEYNNYMTVRLSFSIFILISEFDQYQHFACQYL